MRLHRAALLAIPLATLSVATAVPSQPEDAYRPVASQPQPSLSHWRRLSGRLIEKIWTQTPAHEHKDKDSRAKKAIKLEEQLLPAHTLARYGGDVLLRFNISTSDEARSLAEASDTLLLDVWEFANDWVDIRLAQELVPSLLGLLPQSLQHSHVPLLRERELAQAIFETYPTPRDHARHLESSKAAAPSPAFYDQRPIGPAAHPQGAEANIFFTDYQPLSVIQPWMRLLSSLFTTHVRLITIGKSAQGRDIPGLRIGVHPTNDDDPEPSTRKTVLITAGLHAREWISTSTANYIAYTLITGFGKVPSITRMLEDFDFVIVPTLNPDGYVYTWETDRLWRKNRQQTSIRFCQGMDLDHSFGFHWDGSSTAGNPCSESYAGEKAFEAVEARQLADWARNETDNNVVEFIGLMDLHSYSQQILYPYSFSCNDLAPGLEDLEELGYGLQKAIRRAHGHVYEVLPACEGNAVAGGASGKKAYLPQMENRGGSGLDWFYHEMHVRWAYQLKLRDRGTYGFLLPKEHIIPTGKEMVDAIMYFGEFLQEAYSTKGKAAASENDDQSVSQQEVERSHGEGAKVSEDQAEIGSTLSGKASQILAEDLESEAKWDLRKRRAR
jgi:extracellular matrix protein 14